MVGMWEEEGRGIEREGGREGAREGRERRESERRERERYGEMGEREGGDGSREKEKAKRGERRRKGKDSSFLNLLPCSKTCRFPTIFFLLLITHTQTRLGGIHCPSPRYQQPTGQCSISNGVCRLEGNSATLNTWLLTLYYN